jgi:ketosteroid isomerase-like protein
MRLSALLFGAVLLGCQTSQPPAIERALRAQYDKLERAFAARDADAVIAMRAPEFETFGPQGQRDGYEAMAEYTRIWLRNNKPPIEVRFTLDGIDVRSADEVAVNTIQWASRYQEIEGKLRKVEHEVRQRETWIRTPDGWRLRKVDQIDLANRKRWIDGVLQSRPPLP